MRNGYGQKSHKKPEKKKPGTMNVILVIVGMALFVFTVTMIVVFMQCGAIPDTLVTCVFAALGGECGIMGWIKTNKDKQKEREEFLEDRQHDEEKTMKEDNEL